MNDTRRPARARRLLATAGMLAVGLLTTSCVTLPNSATPQTIGTFNRQPANEARSGPQPGLAPDQLLQSFLDASREPDSMHAEARLYLTKDASRRWNDGASTTIVEDAVVQQESRTDTHATYLVRATKVGELLEGGVYQPDSGPFQEQISLSEFGTDWRIDELPPGVVLKQDEFLGVYHQYALYFLNPSDTALVPDVRWIAGGRDRLANELVAKLLTGPSAALAPAVKNEFAGGVSLNSLARADGGTAPIGVGLGGIRIDFHGAGALDQRDRELLAAQVYWTLQDAGLTGPYQVLADGKPLDDRFPDNWPEDNVEALNPQPDLGSGGLDAVVDGALMSVGDNSTTRVPGFFGSAGTLRVVSLSYDRKVVAAVATSTKGPGPLQLMIGGYSGPPSLVATGGAITQPTWSLDNSSVWAVVNGTKIVRAVRDQVTGIVSGTDVDASQILPLGRPITALRLSRDGVRAALIIDGKLYVAMVEVGQDGRYALTGPRMIPLEPGANALALSWDTGDVALLVSEDFGTALVKVSVDGSSVEPAVTQNLTPPVLAIDVAGQTDYVLDSRTVLQLKTVASDEDKFWREVPELIGEKAVPALPG